LGHDRRIQKIKFLLLRRRFYLGLYFLLPAFFVLFALGPFMVVEAQQGLSPALEPWMWVFALGALAAGLVVAYALLRPAKRFLQGPGQDTEEFASLGADFKALAASLKRYISTLEGLAGGVITASARGSITMANTPAARLLGLEPQRLRGMNIQELLPLGAGLARALREGTAQVELQQGKRHLQVGITAIEGGKGVVLSLLDITGLREFYQAQQKTERLANVGSLAMQVAHDVRNPLASIKGLLELMAEDMPPQGPQARYIEVIRQQLQRLNQVVERLLNYRQAGPEPLEAMLHRAVLMGRQALGQKEVNVVEDYALQGPCLAEERLFQGLYNIVLNALEAVEPGGEVLLRAQEQGQHIVVDVESSSRLPQGLEAQELFAPHVSTKGPHRGLGLALAREAVEASGGRIELQSTKGGTRFRIWLRRTGC